MKVCGGCKEEKALSEFALKRGKPQWQCRVCQAAYRKSHYQANRQKYIDKASKNKKKYREDYIEWLRTQSCADCGITDIRVFEFDHLFDKKFNIADKVGYVTLDTLLTELAKGEIVCANCHRIRTSKRGNWSKALLVSEV